MLLIVKISLNHSLLTILRKLSDLFIGMVIILIILQFLIEFLRDLNQISIERDLSDTSQKHLKTMSLIRLKHISKRCLIRDVSETSQKHLSQAFVIFQKYPTKMVSCDLRRFVTISDKIDVGQLETPTKFYIFWEQFMYFNQVCHEHIGLISA